MFDSCPVVHQGRWGLKYRGVWGSRSERRNIYGKRFLSPPCNRQCLTIGGSPATQEPAHRGSTHPSLPGEGRLTAACGSQLPHGRRVVHHGRRSSMGSAPLPGWRHARFHPLAPYLALKCRQDCQQPRQRSPGRRGAIQGFTQGDKPDPEPLQRIFPPDFGERRTISESYLNSCSIM